MAKKKRHQLTDDIFSMNAKINYLVRKKIQLSFEANSLPLTIEQFGVLVKLWETDGLTQQQLANLLGKDRPRMTRLVDQLQTKDLVNRIAHESDKRINLIYLTPKAMEIKDFALDISRQAMNDAFGWVDKKQLQNITQVFKKAVKKMEKNVS